MERKLEVSITCADLTYIHKTAEDAEGIAALKQYAAGAATTALVVVVRAIYLGNRFETAVYANGGVVVAREHGNLAEAA